MAKRNVVATTGLLAGMLVVTTQAGPIQVIDDRSFFENIPHTLIDFESRMNGTPIILNEGQVLHVLPGEYRPLGVAFEGSADPGVLRIGNAASAHFDVAQEIIGSLDNSVAHPGRQGWFDILFVDSVFAFGISIINRSDGFPVELLAFDSDDQLLSTTSFTGSLIDGAVDGSLFGNAFSQQYGFAGAYDASGRIQRVRVMEDLTGLDDLHFAVVPEPLTLVLVLVISMTGYLRTAFGKRHGRVERIPKPLFD